jgi:hypothetical protein
VVVTSVPKAGTNMLMHVLSLFPQLTIEETLILLPVEKQLERIARLRSGRVVSIHLAPRMELDSVLDQHNVQVLFISRDPRDVCVSLFHYIKKQPEHHFHSYYNALPDDDSRMLTIIKGHDQVLPDGTRLRLPSVDVNFRRRMPWFDHPRCCAVTFEELVGPDGGGNSEQQRSAIRRMAKHLGLRLSKKDLDLIASNVFSPQSPTFRRGQIGSWRKEMTEAHKVAFKEVAGQLLIDLGYERDLDW